LTNWKPLSPARQHHLRLGTAYGMTDTGLVRKANEDNFLIDEKLGLVVVADGMGGHQAGEVASADAILALREFIGTSPVTDEVDDDITIPARIAALLQRSAGAHVDPDRVWSGWNTPALIAVCDAVAFANERIYSRNLASGVEVGGGMGTTLTGFWQIAEGGTIVVFHVGDSRLYRYRPGELIQLTRDQTLYQQSLDAGIRDNLPPRNMLLQAVGPTASIAPDIAAFCTRPGDLYLLCSDGLHGKVPPTAIQDVLSRSTVYNLAESCAALIELANRHEGRDNTTVVLTLCS
jgi:PPM family protein phosphatase